VSLDNKGDLREAREKLRDATNAAGMAMNRGVSSTEVLEDLLWAVNRFLVRWHDLEREGGGE